jgi:hypothetical protein
MAAVVAKAIAFAAALLLFNPRAMGIFENSMDCLFC